MIYCSRGETRKKGRFLSHSSVSNSICESFSWIGLCSLSWTVKGGLAKVSVGLFTGVKGKDGGS